MQNHTKPRLMYIKQEGDLFRLMAILADDRVKALSNCPTIGDAKRQLEKQAKLYRLKRSGNIAQ